jgi:membrane-associated phospholipid phosphatase
MALAISDLYADRTETVAKIGDYIQIAIPLTAWGTTLCLGDTEGQIQFYESFATNIAVTHGLKYLVKEKRPDSSNLDSFPSGHTSASFQGATFIHLRYGLKYAIPAYIAATYVGFSRVYANKHYTHDVIAGAVIGSASALIFTDKYKNIDISPIVYNGTYGATIKYTF